MKKTLFSDRITNRAKECGEYIAETGATIRATAKKIGFSKSTVHKDVSERLPLINKRLYQKARKKLEKNLAERAVRGGIATKLRYEKMNDEAI